MGRMERSTDVVTEAACRSREHGEFDGCPACRAAALNATERTVFYVLRRAALRGPIELAGLDEPASAVRIRIVDSAAGRSPSTTACRKTLASI
jgi:hypothetical protein